MSNRAIFRPDGGNPIRGSPSASIFAPRASSNDSATGAGVRGDRGDGFSPLIRRGRSDNDAGKGAPIAPETRFGGRSGAAPKRRPSAAAGAPAAAVGRPTKGATSFGAANSRPPAPDSSSHGQYAVSDWGAAPDPGQTGPQAELNTCGGATLAVADVSFWSIVDVLIVFEPEFCCPVSETSQCILLPDNG